MCFQVAGERKSQSHTYTYKTYAWTHIHIKERKQTQNLRYSKVTKFQDKIVRVELIQLAYT